jgi:hypothetical protein
MAATNMPVVFINRESKLDWYRLSLDSSLPRTFEPDISFMLVFVTEEKVSRTFTPIATPELISTR